MQNPFQALAPPAAGPEIPQTPQIPEIIVELKHVSRNFKRHRVLEDFNLKIAKGSFVSLLGPSGSGKSTLLRLIAGLEYANSGEVIVKSDRKFSKSFVFQDANLLPWRNVRENLQLVLELTGMRADLAEVLEIVGLLDHAEKYPNQLSGGMRMRVAVARALITQPSLLLLDEPFAALDENARHRLQEELRQIWQKRHKMTIIFVTHSLSEAVFLSERVIVLGGSPTQIARDHHVNLPQERPASLRMDLGYLTEVQSLSRSFDVSEAK